jgi:hypothetical protein
MPKRGPRTVRLRRPNTPPRGPDVHSSVRVQANARDGAAAGGIGHRARSAATGGQAGATHRVWRVAGRDSYRCQVTSVAVTVAV